MLAPLLTALGLALAAAGPVSAKEKARPPAPAIDAAFFPVPPRKPEPRIPTALDMVQRAGFSPERVGFVLFDTDSGTILDSHQPDAAFIPASVMKIPTSVAALAAFGADHRFTTEVRATGRVREGVLEGDLYLVGGGDPVLDGRRIDALAEALLQRGVRAVKGRFFYDETLLRPIPAIEPSQPEDSTYNPGLSALTAEFSRVRMSWDKEGDGGPIAYEETPAVDTVALLRAAAPIPDGKPFLWQDQPLGEAWLLSPTVRGKGERWLPVKKAGLHTASLLRAAAALKGLVLPVPTPSATPAEAVPLAATQSPSLATIVRLNLKYSNNLISELIGQMAARQAGGAVPESLRHSATWQTNWLKRLLPALDWTGFEAANHSGLSAESRSTPRQMASILALAESLKLPRGGYAALLPTRIFRPSQLRELQPDEMRVNAKSGTMYYGRGLAGRLTTRGGRELGFALFISDLRRRAVFDEALADGGPGPGEAAQARRWLGRAKDLEAAILETWTISGDSSLELVAPRMNSETGNSNSARANESG